MFRFTIREVLLTMALSGTGLGWWIDHRALSISRNQAFADCERLLCLCEPSKYVDADAIERDFLQPLGRKYCSWPRPPEVKAAWAYNRRLYGNSYPNARIIHGP
jgi:hypothetical protein